jgi:hypothetical protein
MRSRSIRIKLHRRIIDPDHIPAGNRNTAILPDMAVVMSDWRGVKSPRIPAPFQIELLLIDVESDSRCEGDEWYEVKGQRKKGDQPDISISSTRMTVYIRRVGGRVGYEWVTGVVCFICYRGDVVA